MKPLILASASPRRREILQNAGIPFTVLVTNADESLPSGTAPGEAVRLLSLRKAEAALREAPAGAVVLAADTVVAAKDETGVEVILGKPHTAEKATAMLRLLSGKTHRVLTGITLTDGKTTVTDCVSTDVVMRELSDREIARYVATGAPLDKAGAYGIQERAGVFVRGLSGDYFNVVGLPLARTAEILRDTFGFDV